MSLPALDLAIVTGYAVSIFVLAQWVSCEEGAHRPNWRSKFELRAIDYSTSAGSKVKAVIIAAILIGIYATWW
jgi:hypothetical protein